MVGSVAAMENRRAIPPPRPRFFAYMATVILLLVIVAFLRSFYFREFSTVVDRVGMRELLPHLVVHGWVLTTWYVVLCTQSWLVVYRRLAIHRALGFFGLIVALGVVWSGWLTTLRVIPRNLEAGRPLSATASIVVSNTVALVMFVSLIVCAIYLRRRGDFHKRLMLLASMVIMQPVFAGAVTGTRLVGGFFGLFLPRAVTPYLFEVAMLIAIAAMVIHDRGTFRAIHPATKWGGVATLIALAVSVAIRTTPAGAMYVQWLS